MAYHLFFPKVSSNKAVPACFHIVCASICLIIEFSRCKRGFVSPIVSNIYSVALQRKGGHFELDFLFICSQRLCCNDASLVWYLSRGAHGMDQGYVDETWRPGRRQAFGIQGCVLESKEERVLKNWAVMSPSAWLQFQCGG